MDHQHHLKSDPKFGRFGRFSRGGDALGGARGDDDGGALGHGRKAFGPRSHGLRGYGRKAFGATVARPSGGLRGAFGGPSGVRAAKF